MIKPCKAVLTFCEVQIPLSGDAIGWPASISVEPRPTPGSQVRLPNGGGRLWRELIMATLESFPMAAHGGPQSPPG